MQRILGHRLDHAYYLMTSALEEPCFTKGWGDTQTIKDIVDLSYQAQQSEDYSARDDLITNNLQLSIIREKIIEKDSLRLITGKFKSPAAQYLPKECEDCFFEMIIPQNTRNEATPLVIQYSMTGDHGFSMRRDIGTKLLHNKNIASLSIQNPFYGARKPSNQIKSSLLYVSDIMVKGVALVCEGLSLIEYMKKNQNLGNYGPFGVTGISMGGHMAALAGCNSLDPIVVVPCLSPYSASPVFTEALLSKWVDWDTLDKQLPDYLTNEQKASNMSSKAFMRYLLDSTTDLTRFRAPKCPQSTIQVSAMYDGYVPDTGTKLHNHWKGSELRWTPYSHVSAIALGQSQFISAISDAFRNLEKETHS